MELIHQTGAEYGYFGLKRVSLPSYCIRKCEGMKICLRFFFPKLLVFTHIIHSPWLFSPPRAFLGSCCWGPPANWWLNPAVPRCELLCKGYGTAYSADCQLPEANLLLCWVASMFLTPWRWCETSWCTILGTTWDEGPVGVSSQLQLPQMWILMNIEYIQLEFTACSVLEAAFSGTSTFPKGEHRSWCLFFLLSAVVYPRKNHQCYKHSFIKPGEDLTVQDILSSVAFCCLQNV